MHVHGENRRSTLPNPQLPHLVTFTESIGVCCPSRRIQHIWLLARSRPVPPARSGMLGLGRESVSSKDTPTPLWLSSFPPMVHSWHQHQRTRPSVCGI